MVHFFIVQKTKDFYTKGEIQPTGIMNYIYRGRRRTSITKKEYFYYIDVTTIPILPNCRFYLKS